VGVFRGGSETASKQNRAKRTFAINKTPRAKSTPAAPSPRGDARRGGQLLGRPHRRPGGGGEVGGLVIEGGGCAWSWGFWLLPPKSLFGGAPSCPSGPGTPTPTPPKQRETQPHPPGHAPTQPNQPSRPPTHPTHTNQPKQTNQNPPRQEQLLEHGAGRRAPRPPARRERTTVSGDDDDWDSEASSGSWRRWAFRI
jgi:hypothetical protein